jgi:hypothetical protein
MAELIVFADANFSGIHTHIFGSIPATVQLSTLKIIGSLTGSSLPSADAWDKEVSSFIVVSGLWKFFIRNGQLRGAGNVLLQDGSTAFGPKQDDGSPNFVSFVENVEIDNDAITSVELVSP